jgi:hypothetical protein
MVALVRLLTQSGFLLGGQVALSALGIEKKQEDDGVIFQVEVHHLSACAFSSFLLVSCGSCENLLSLGSSRPYSDSAEARFPIPTLLPGPSALLPVL